MPEKNELSILIVNWNGEKYIGDCLKSIGDTIKSCSYEIIVVDNDSADRSCELIKKKFPEVKLIEYKENSLFAKGNNIAYEHAEGKIIALVNPDIVAKPGVFDQLIDECRKNTGTAFTTVLYNADDTIQYRMHRGFPTFMRLFFSMLSVYRGWFSGSKIVKKYFLSDLDFSKDQFIDQAAGALIFLQRDHINKIGGLLDEELFPLFYNDVDLCRRLWDNNIPVLCKATDGVYHLKGASIKMLKFDYNLNMKLTGAQNYFRKHKQRMDYILVSILLFIISLFKKK